MYIKCQAFGSQATCLGSPAYPIPLPQAILGHPTFLVSNMLET